MVIGLHIKVVFYFFIHGFNSPLQLRNSIRRLSRNNSHPYLALLRLFIPYPTWRFALPDPVPPQEILGNAPLLLQRRREEDISNLSAVPVWRARDTPLRSLHRIYENMMSGAYAAVGSETEYFFYQPHWAVHDIPDPRVPDPIRYAMLACIVEELVRVFNWRMGLGLRRDEQHIIPDGGAGPYPQFEQIRSPVWAGDVPPIGRESLALLPLEYVDDGRLLVLGKKGGRDAFERRNVVADAGWLYTVGGKRWLDAQTKATR